MRYIWHLFHRINLELMKNSVWNIHIPFEGRGIQKKMMLIHLCTQTHIKHTENISFQRSCDSSYAGE